MADTKSLKKRENMQGTLTIFDLDDTLFYCKAKVYVARPDGTKFQIRSSLDYELQEGETIDYEEFRSSKLFAETAIPIDNMVKRFKDIRTSGVNPHSKVVILTARADFDDRELFLKTLEHHGVYYPDVHVYRSGNIELPIPTSEKKCMVIRSLIQQGSYDKVRLFDDSYSNLRAFKQLTHPGIAFEVWHVDHTGECKRF